MVWRPFLSMLALVVAPGCATVLGGTKPQPVYVTTNAPDSEAEVFLDSAPLSGRVRLPAVVGLPPRGEVSVRVEAPGYDPVVVSPKREVNPLVLANCLMGGLVGILVDYLSGAAFRYASQLYVELRRSTSLDPPVPFVSWPAPKPAAAGSGQPRPLGGEAEAPGRAEPTTEWGDAPRPL